MPNGEGGGSHHEGRATGERGRAHEGDGDVELRDMGRNGENGGRVGEGIGERPHDRESLRDENDPDRDATVRAVAEGGELSSRSVSNDRRNDSSQPAPLEGGSGIGEPHVPGVEGVESQLQGNEQTFPIDSDQANQAAGFVNQATENPRYQALALIPAPRVYAPGPVGEGDGRTYHRVTIEDYQKAHARLVREVAQEKARADAVEERMRVLEDGVESLGGRIRSDSGSHAEFKKRAETEFKKIETKNSRRLCLGLGIGVFVGGVLAGAYPAIVAIMAALADEKPLPPDVPQSLIDTLKKAIAEWNTKSDPEFWENMARWVTTPGLEPPITLGDNIEFCYYVMRVFPIPDGGIYTFDFDVDRLRFVIELVLEFRRKKEGGGDDLEAAAAMYRLVSTFRYSSRGAPEAPFPRAIQATILAEAFGVVASSPDRAELMALADQWAAKSDPDYWAAFVRHLEERTVALKPLSVADQISFCDITSALSERVDMMYQRPDTEALLVVHLVAAADAATRSTLGLYRIAHELSETPGLPFKRDLQAKLVGDALALLASPDFGPPTLVKARKFKEAQKADLTYWNDFSAFVVESKMTLEDQADFCAYTTELNPAGVNVTAPSETEMQAIVAQLLAIYRQSNSVKNLYVRLARLKESDPQYPLTIQAEAMRRTLVQIRYPSPVRR